MIKCSIVCSSLRGDLRIKDTTLPRPSFVVGTHTTSKMNNPTNKMDKPDKTKVTESQFTTWFDAQVPTLHKIVTNLVNSEGGVCFSDSEGVTTRVISPYSDKCVLAVFTEERDGIFQCRSILIVTSDEAKKRVTHDVFRRLVSAMPNKPDSVNLVVVVILDGQVTVKPFEIPFTEDSISKDECSNQNDVLWKSIEFIRPSVPILPT